MERIPKAVYTPEFRAEAVALVFRDGLKASEAARRLAISKKTLDNWLMRSTAGKWAHIGPHRCPGSE